MFLLPAARCWRKWIGLGLLLIPSVSLLWYVCGPNSFSKRSLFHHNSQLQGSVGGITNKTLRIVHLDLKGAPPRLNYLRKLLTLMASQGCDGLLIEYEDMFPYSGHLVNLSAMNSFTPTEVKSILSWAHDLGMEVIPLVQTLGHLEFALKLEEFRPLRESDLYPQEVCPSNDKSLQLIESMIEQVMALHPSAKFLHIGCDEVFHMNMCKACVSKQLTKRELYEAHVVKVVEVVKKKYPHVRILIWDDMIRQWPPQNIAVSPLINLVEPVVWVYTDQIANLLPTYIWYWYGKSFSAVWIASAFKGATLPTTTIPDIVKHFKNHLAWISFVEKSPSNIAGIVLTGWSRFDHFAVLCELLPTAIPSLMLNLQVVSRRSIGADHLEIFHLWRQSLSCPRNHHFDVYSLSYDQTNIMSCKFLGVNAYSQVIRYLLLKVKVDTVLDQITDKDGWMTSYNRRHNFTSPWRLSTEITKVKDLATEVSHYRKTSKLALTEYIDNYAVDEWMELKVVPLEKKVAKTLKTMNSLLVKRVWPRRPLY